MRRNQKPLIVASNSPRRASLLQQIGLKFKAIPPIIEETRKPGETPIKYVLRIAAAKAESVAESYPEDFVLGADTIVLIDREILGKPAGEQQAREMLRKLSGRTHQVITGLALMNKKSSFFRKTAITTRVEFRALSATDIERYLSTGEPFDKAGGYGIQGRGALFVRSIKGCYFNVVGLPIARLAELLREANFPIW